MDHIVLSFKLKWGSLFCIWDIFCCSTQHW